MDRVSTCCMSLQGQFYYKLSQLKSTVNWNVFTVKYGKQLLCLQCPSNSSIHSVQVEFCSNVHFSGKGNALSTLPVRCSELLCLCSFYSLPLMSPSPLE